MEKLTKEEKNRQISKEVKISVVLYVCFFLWWYFTGYGFAGLSSKANTIVMGLPLWFFLSCIVGYVLFCVASIIICKKCFKEFSLEEEEGDE